MFFIGQFLVSTLFLNMALSTLSSFLLLSLIWAYSSFLVAESLYWPQFILAVLAAIIASQSLISATFSIVQQCVKLGCFPGIKVVHTSTTCKGQVYLPEVNTFLMGACVGITLGFKNTLKIGNAYGNLIIMPSNLFYKFVVREVHRFYDEFQV